MLHFIATWQLSVIILQPPDNNQTLLARKIYLRYFICILCKHLICWMFLTHDDSIKWKHFSRYWPFVWGIHWSPVNSLHKGHWCNNLMFSLICTWINGWVNSDEAGDLRCHHAHYEVTVMRTKKYSDDLHHFSALRWCRYLKSLHMDIKKLFRLHCQYRGWWWCSNARGVEGVGVVEGWCWWVVEGWGGGWGGRELKKIYKNVYSVKWQLFCQTVVMVEWHSLIHLPTAPK